MKAFIKRKKEIARDTILIEFESDRDFSFLPGQYFFITLLDPLYRDEKGSMRHFTIVNSPHRKRILSLATIIRESAFKKSIMSMPINAEVKIDQIYGDFILPSKFSTSLVFIAVGIGITPFMSMLRFLEYKKKKYNITLIYSNRDQESAAFLEELRALAKKNENFELILIFTNDKDWQGEKRKIDEDLLRFYFPSYRSKIFYVSGSPTVVKNIRFSLLDLGVKKDNIKRENFSGY